MTLHAKTLKQIWYNAILDKLVESWKHELVGITDKRARKEKAVELERAVLNEAVNSLDHFYFEL